MANVIKELKNKWLFVILQYYNITILQYYNMNYYIIFNVILL